MRSLLSTDESSDKDEPTVNRMCRLTNAMERSLQMGRCEAFPVPDLPRWQVVVAKHVYVVSPIGKANCVHSLQWHVALYTQPE